MLSLTSPVETYWHKIPAVVKLLCLCIVTALLFFTDDLLVLFAALSAAFAAYMTAGRRLLSVGFRQLKSIWPFLVILSLWHGISGDWHQGAVIALRMTTVLAFANLLTLTTQLSAMLALFERLISPLSVIGMPVHAISIAIAMVIRFTPHMIEVANQLQIAWRARSPRGPKWRIAVPLLVAGLDDADHVAMALRARGGLENFENHRTK